METTKASSQGHLDIVEYCMNKTNINIEEYKGLFYASVQGNQSIVEFFIEKGTDKGEIEFNKAIAFAALGGYISVINFIMSIVPENYIIDFNYSLLYSIQNDIYLSIVKFCVEHGATNIQEALDLAIIITSTNRDYTKIINYLRSKL